MIRNIGIFLIQFPASKKSHPVLFSIRLMRRLKLNSYTSAVGRFLDVVYRNIKRGKKKRVENILIRI